LQRPAAAPSSKNPLVPGELDILVLGCLRRSPKDRYRTPSEVLSAWDALDEARARTLFKMRKLLPLAIPAALGVLLAYLLATKPKPGPSADAARVASARHVADNLPSALIGADPRLDKPRAYEPPPRSPAPKISAPRQNEPTPAQPAGQTPARKPEPPAAHGATSADALPPQRSPLQPSPLQPSPLQPSPLQPAPVPEARATASFANALSRLPAWENPFGTGGASSATQLTGSKEPTKP
jgi:hypothetical protein